MFRKGIALVNTKIFSSVLGKMPPTGLKTLAIYAGIIILAV